MPSHRSILALIDSSPVLMLPSTLACRERFADDVLHVTLAGPVQAEGAMQRLARVLGRHDISAEIAARAETLEATVTAWLASLAPHAVPILDVSSASGGTATRAVLAMQREVDRQYQLCWFHEANNEVHLSNGGPPDARVIDIGSTRSVRSAITPVDFMAIFGLERAFEDPYCGVENGRLVPIAGEILRIAMEHPDDHRKFRGVLAAARARVNCTIATSAIPPAFAPVLSRLAEIDGWIQLAGANTVLGGTSSTLSVFFLSGGWLEVVVAEAIRRALPDHRVQVNCGTAWGRKRRAEAEMDVAFVYHNALYLVSCKNDHLTDRFFPHLDRFRALTAEFGESRTRPLLLSTAELERRHIRRCDAYEIGQLSGATLLESIDRSLKDEPDRLLKALLTVSRGAPRAGIA